MTASGFSAIRERVAQVIMCLLSLSTVAVFVDALLLFGSVPPEMLAVEAWRMFGYVVFAGLFAIVGFWPQRQPGLWELLFFHKASTALFLIPYLGADAGGAVSVSKGINTVVITDFALAGFTLAGYVLARGWRAWRIDRPS